MKKFISFFLISIMLFTVTACFEISDTNEYEEQEVLSVNLDDFIKKYDNLVESLPISGRQYLLWNEPYKIINNGSNELPMTEYYPSVNKEYRYDVRIDGNTEIESIDILTDSEDNILYIGHKILASEFSNDTDEGNIFFTKNTLMFAAMFDKDFESAYDNELSNAWDLAADNISGNDELEIGNYKYFYTSGEGGYIVLVIRAKFDNEFESITNEQETKDNEIKNQEKTTQVNDSEKQVKKVRQCLSCKRVIGASEYDYCDGCRCRHIQGCPMIRKSGSSYCVSHACEKSGCSLERTSTSDYCDLHRNN